MNKAITALVFAGLITPACLFAAGQTDTGGTGSLNTFDLDRITLKSLKNMGTPDAKGPSDPIEVTGPVVVVNDQALGIKYVEKNLHMAEQEAMKRLKKDGQIYGQFPYPTTYVTYYDMALEDMKKSPATTFKESFETLIYVNTRMLWIMEQASLAHPDYFEAFQKDVREAFGRIEKSVSNARTLAHIRSDIDVIASQFLNNR